MSIGVWQAASPRWSVGRKRRLFRQNSALWLVMSPPNAAERLLEVRQPSLPLTGQLLRAHLLLILLLLLACMAGE